jgi:hypothetical protein
MKTVKTLEESITVLASDRFAIDTEFNRTIITIMPVAGKYRTYRVIARMTLPSVEMLTCSLEVRKN